MHRYIARTNVDNYLSLLGSDGLTPQDRTVITKLLITEEDRLSHDLEHLGFAEIRAAKGRERVKQVRNSRENSGTSEREQVDRLLTNLENIQTLLEDFCHQFRARAKSHDI